MLFRSGALLSSPELNSLAASHCLDLNWALDIYLASAPAMENATRVKSDPITFENMADGLARMKGGAPPGLPCAHGRSSASHELHMPFVRSISHVHATMDGAVSVAAKSAVGLHYTAKLGTTLCEKEPEKPWGDCPNRLSIYTYYRRHSL